MKEHIWPIQLGDNPICKYNSNNTLTPGCFPCSFLRGGKALPNSAFSPSLMRHLILHHDRRFEQCYQFIRLLVNQQMCGIAMRRIVKSSASNLDYLNKISSLISSSDFKESLILASKNPNNPRSTQLNEIALKLISFAGKDTLFSPFKKA